MKKHFLSCLLTLVVPLLASSQICFSWQKQYGLGNDFGGDQFNCVERHPSGSLIFLNYNRYLVEISPDGEVLQEKPLQMPNGMVPRKIAFASNGDGFIAADNFSANCAGDINSEVRLYRLHANTLDTVWERTLDISWFYILGITGRLVVDESAEQIFVATNLAVYKLDFDGNLLKKKTTWDLDSTSGWIYHFERLENGNLRLLRGNSLITLDTDLNVISTAALQYSLPFNSYFGRICSNPQNGNLLLSVHNGSTSENSWEIIKFSASGDKIWKKSLNHYNALSPLVWTTGDEIWVFNHQEIEVWNNAGIFMQSIDLGINPSRLNDVLHLPDEKHVLAGAEGGSSLALFVGCQESASADGAATTNVSISPNPSGEWVEISFDYPGECHLQLFDGQGRMLKAAYFTSRTALRVGDLRAGTYTLFFWASSDRFATRKLAVQH